MSRRERLRAAEERLAASRSLVAGRDTAPNAIARRADRRAIPRESALTFVAGILIAALFAGGTVARAGQKLFWHDEIIAAVIAGLPPGGMWSALRDGVDLNPPGFHLLLRGSQAVFGEGLIRSRIPSAAAVLLAAFCVGVFVRRQFGSLAGISAILVFLCTDAYFYAYETRPYGGLLAWAALTFVCWQAAARPTRHITWLAGLFVSLSAALTFHYYAVLLFLPIAAAEVNRLIRTKQRDWPLWLAVGCSTFPLLLLWPPLIAGAREFSPRDFSQPSLRTVVESYVGTVAELGVPLMLVLVAAACALLVVTSDHGDNEQSGRGSEHEWVLAVSLVLLPVFAFVLALGWTGALVPGDYLPWTLGLAMLAPMIVAHLVRPWRRFMAVLVGVFFLWFAARQLTSARLITRQGPDLASVYPSLVHAPDGDLPIVVGHPHVYLVALYYSPPDLQSRLVTLTPAGGVQPGSDTTIRVFRGLSQWAPIHLERYDEFIGHHRRFLVYGPSSSRVLEWLRVAGALLVLRSIDEDAQLFSMSRPGPNHLYEVTLPPEPAAAQLR